MSKTAIRLAAAIAGSAAALTWSAVASASPHAYDECDASAYAVDLDVQLDKASFSGDRDAAIARAQTYAANATGEISGDATTLVHAEVAVLNGAPSEATLRADPVIQAWGDVLDWHTIHCLGGPS